MIPTCYEIPSGGQSWPRTVKKYYLSHDLKMPEFDSQPEYFRVFYIMRITYLHQKTGILHTVLKVAYTLYIVPTGLGALAGFLSIDIMSLTGQSVNRQMKDAKKRKRSINTRKLKLALLYFGKTQIGSEY